MQKEKTKNPQSVYNVVKDFREKCSVNDRWELKTDLTFQQHPYILYTTRIENENGVTVSMSNSIFTTEECRK